MASVFADRAPSWTVVGLDNHKSALRRGRDLAVRALPPSSHSAIQFDDVDLRKSGLEDALAARSALPLRLVHGCRWLNVPLLARIPSLLAPGGIFIWSTFLDPPDGGEPLAPP